MKVKTAGAAFKAIGGEKSGRYEALVSVFDVKDSYGEVVRKGAFVDTLEKWAGSDNRIPVIYSHQWASPEMIIGETLDAEEKTKDGKSALWTSNQLFMDEETPALVYSRMKAKVLSQHSFAYDVLDGGMVKEDGDDYYELRTLDLFEHGPCVLGVNQETETVEGSMKSIAIVVDAAAKALLESAKAVQSATLALEAARIASDGGSRGESAAPPEPRGGTRRQDGSEKAKVIHDEASNALAEFAV